MSRDILAHFPIVLTVARLRSFAGAAKALNMSPSAIGHAVRLVEERVGEPLFARTTRSVALTEAGVRFVATIGPAIDDIESGLEHLRAARGEVSGVLRLSAPRVAVSLGLTAVLVKLAWAHPRLTVEVHTNDAFVDIVAEGFDAGVRLGEAVQQDMAAVRLTPPLKAILVAAPSYIAARGEPRSIADLVAHNCIGFRLGAGDLYEWDLREGEADVQVRVSGTTVVNDSTYARDLALAGIGVAYVFEPQVRADIREGRLKWLLPDSAIEENGLFVYFPRRASEAPKLRAFLEMVRALARP